MGRPIPPLVLDDAERETLEQWTRRPKTARALALRARIILACAGGRSNTSVAADLLVVSMPMPVFRVVQRQVTGAPASDVYAHGGVSSR